MSTHTTDEVLAEIKRILVLRTVSRGVMHAYACNFRLGWYRDGSQWAIWFDDQVLYRGPNRTEARRVYWARVKEYQTGLVSKLPDPTA
jgi:hypothetical protein